MTTSSMGNGPNYIATNNMFDDDQNEDYEIIESGRSFESKDNNNFCKESNWVPLKDCTSNVKIFRTPNGLQRTATYTTTASQLYAQRNYFDETRRAVDSVDSSVMEDHFTGEIEPEDIINDLDQVPSTSEIVPTGKRPLKRLSLSIGKKILRFKVIDVARSAHSDVPTSSNYYQMGEYKCGICTLVFGLREDWAKHMQTAHVPTRPFNCVLCGMGFVTKQSLTIHHRTHSSYKPYQCNICSKTFSRPFNQNLHMKMHMTGQKHFCNICGRCFKMNEALMEHQISCLAHMNGEYVHTEKPLRYQCNYCDRLFHHKRDKNIHERIHTGEKPYQCGYCGRQFSQSQGLTIHIRLHTGEKPYTCLVCGKQYRDNSALRKHEYQHANVTSSLFNRDDIDEDELLEDTDDYQDSVWDHSQ